MNRKVELVDFPLGSSPRKSARRVRCARLASALVLSAAAIGCSADEGDSTYLGTGGSPVATGGASSTGGNGVTTGGISGSSGGSGGTPSAGGSSNGGAATTGGGSATGGNGTTGGTAGASSATGGTGTTGGANTAGATTGGQVASGGSAGSAGKASTGGAGGKGSGGTSGGSGGKASTGGTAGAATGGSGGAVECTGAAPPQPPTAMKETIDITWKEMTGGFSGKMGARGASRAIQTYPSWALDHVHWGSGTLNFCVRWDSEQPVSETLRDQVSDALSRGVNAWFSALVGYDCYPYNNIAVKITGWATRNRSTFQWTDDSFVPLFINQLRDGAPDCPDACSRNLHQDGKYQFPNCTGGFANRFDQEVWLTESYDAPNGWDFGQHVDRAGFQGRVTGALYHIWLHEFGHGIGFPDYYDWSTWAPGVAAPACVMNAGAATTVTEWDKWMFRRTWSEMRAAGRYK